MKYILIQLNIIRLLPNESDESTIILFYIILFNHFSLDLGFFLVLAAF